MDLLRYGINKSTRFDYNIKQIFLEIPKDTLYIGIEVKYVY